MSLTIRKLENCSVYLRVSSLLCVLDPVLELPLGVGLQLPDVVHRHAEPLVRPAPHVLVEGEEDFLLGKRWLGGLYSEFLDAIRIHKWINLTTGLFLSMFH